MNENARCPAPAVQDYLKSDSRPVPEVLTQKSDAYLGSADLARERYFSPEFHRLEVEKMWKKVWQMACREEDIPNTGDHVVYDIAGESILVVRSAPDSIRAFYNVCLHRGRLLKNCDGSSQTLRCPFHAFTWRLDGTLKEIPCRWDFPHVKDEDLRLPEVKTGIWNGFVFINLDPGCESLESYLGKLPGHFRNWDLSARYKSAHVGKVIPANWKVCAEAFMESYHVIATHPQILSSTADANTQYDVWPDQPHWNRMITVMGVSSPHLGEAWSDERVFDAMLDEYGKTLGSKLTMKIPPDKTARAAMGSMLRGSVAGAFGERMEISDSELLDAIQYFVFPNFFPWGGQYFQNFIYRFRPNGNDPDSALMELMLLTPFRKNGDRPKAAKYRLLGPDEPWSAAKEIGVLGPVFDQDMSNLPYIQKGLHAMKKDVTLGNYQEIRIRHLHQTLDRYIYGR